MNPISQKTLDELSALTGTVEGDIDREQQGVIGDVVDAAQKGVYDGVAGAAESFGADSTRDWALDKSKQQVDSMSDAGRESFSKPFVTEDVDGRHIGEGLTDPRAIAMTVAHMIGMNADIFAGGGLVKGGRVVVTKLAKAVRQKLGSKIKDPKVMQEATETATRAYLEKVAKRKNLAEGVFDYGTATHAVAGGLQAIDVRDEVNEMDFDELEKAPAFVQMVRGMRQQYPDVKASELLSAARARLADEAASRVKTNPTLLASNYLIGGLGGVALERMLTGVLPKGVTIASEFGTEFAQGSAEQFAANQELQAAADPDRDVTEGVITSGLNEGIAGGFSAGAMAGGRKVYEKAMGIEPATLPNNQQGGNEANQQSGNEVNKQSGNKVNKQGGNEVNQQGRKETPLAGSLWDDYFKARYQGAAATVDEETGEVQDGARPAYLMSDQGTPFANEGQAKQFAAQYGLNDYVTVKTKGGFVMQRPTPSLPDVPLTDANEALALTRNLQNEALRRKESGEFLNPGALANAYKLIGNKASSVEIEQAMDAALVDPQRAAIEKWNKQKNGDPAPALSAPDNGVASAPDNGVGAKEIDPARKWLNANNASQEQIERNQAFDKMQAPYPADRKQRDYDKALLQKEVQNLRPAARDAIKKVFPNKANNRPKVSDIAKRVKAKRKHIVSTLEQRGVDPNVVQKTKAVLATYTKPMKEAEGYEPNQVFADALMNVKSIQKAIDKAPNSEQELERVSQVLMDMYLEAEQEWYQEAEQDDFEVFARNSNAVNRQDGNEVNQQGGNEADLSTFSVDNLANAAATSPTNDLPEPSDAQKEAGNYKKGHVRVHGLDIAIENPKGSKRSGVSADGKRWENEMAHHYGDLKGTKGADGDPIDVFIGKQIESDVVFVVDQVDPDTGAFDEHKVMLGFDSQDAAEQGYLANYDKNWQGMGGVSAVPVSYFKRWLAEGNTLKPFKQQEGSGDVQENVNSNSSGKRVNDNGRDGDGRGVSSGQADSGKSDQQAVGRPGEDAPRDNRLGESVGGGRSDREGESGESNNVDVPATNDGTQSRPDLLTIADISEKAFLVVDPDRSLAERIKNLKASATFDKKLKGWRFSKKRRDEVQAMLDEVNAGSEAAKQQGGNEVKRQGGEAEKLISASELDSKIERFVAEMDKQMYPVARDIQPALTQAGLTLSDVASAWGIKDGTTQSVVNHYMDTFGLHKDVKGWYYKKLSVEKGQKKLKPEQSKEPVEQVDNGKQVKVLRAFDSLIDAIDKFAKADSGKMLVKADWQVLHKLGADAGIFQNDYNGFVTESSGDRTFSNPAMAANVVNSLKQKKQAYEAENGLTSKAEDIDPFANNTLFTADKVAAARARLKSKIHRANAGLDPEILVDGMTIAGAYIESGVRNFKSYAKLMMDDFGDGIKPYLLSFWEGARNYPGLDSTGMTSAAESATLNDEMTQNNGKVVDDENKPAVVKSDSAGVSGASRQRRDSTQQGDARGNQVALDLDKSDDGETLATGEDAGSGGLRDATENVESDGRVDKGGVPRDGRKGNGRKGSSDDGAGGKSSSVKQPPPKSPAAVQGDFYMADPSAIVGGGQVARFDKNKAALELRTQLIDEGRKPTDAEKLVLASYTGWGSFGQELFQGTWSRPMPKDGWEARDSFLREHLGQAEWEGLQTSIINAHYTDPPTVTAIWNMLERMGFTGGKVLEPAIGTGNFFGLMPPDITSRSQRAGIELDGVTGSIAKMLYPSANIQIKGYEQSKTPDNFYDLVVGNWPFADVSPADRRYNKLAPQLHDYFFLKALDQTRPGGLVVGITSSGTMDKKSSNVRFELAKKGELVAAFRLPTGAFQGYAGTKVVTDIIILRKRDKPKELVSDEGWINSEAVDFKLGTAHYNEYYLKHPDHILGDVDFGHGTTFRRMGLIVNPRGDMQAALDKAVSKVPIDAYQVQGKVDHINYVANYTDDRQNSLTKTKDGLHIVRGEYLAPAHEVAEYRIKDKNKTAKRVAELESLITMRGAYGALIDAERNGEADVEAKRAALRKLYRAFVKTSGALSDSYGLNYLRKVEDPFYPALAALENNQNGKVVPAGILSASTMRGKPSLDNPSVADAFVLARSSEVNPSMQAVAKLANRSPEDVRKNLIASGAVFPLPNGDVEAADLFTSGNVRHKLRDARQAQVDGNAEMQGSIDALEKVLPADIPYYKIETQMGATWVPANVYSDYVAHMLGRDDAAGIETIYRGGAWKIKMPGTFDSLSEAQNGYGSKKVGFKRLVNAAISNQSITIRYTDAEGNKHTDKEATTEVNSKIADIRNKFGEWLWQSPERRVDLEREYNEVRNAYAVPSFDGSFLPMEGMALSLGNGPFNLREHQVNAIWRGVATGRSLNAHEVGTGKTFTMAGIALESRRYGKAKKPLLLAHNANSKSVATEIQMMYPGAKVLYVDNLSRGNIQTRMMQIANDDWDVVVMPHSLINRLGFKRETLMGMAQQEIDELETLAYEAAEDDGVTLDKDMLDDENELKRLRSPTAKDLVKQRLRILNSIEKMAMQASSENSIAFEDLGIDMVMVDEVHEFKKPPFATKMRMKGLQADTSNKSIGLFYMAKYIRGLHGGNVHLFSGTPITNTMAEVFHMSRYIMGEEMDNTGVGDWDGWFGSFAREVDDVELTATGDHEAVTRLQAFINVPELRRMLGQYMDVVFADNMPEMQPRQVNGKTLNSADLSESERDTLLNGRTEKAQDRPYKKTVNYSADMSPEQEEAFEHVKSLANEWNNMQGKARKEAMTRGDEVSPIIRDGIAEKASFDVRLIEARKYAGKEGSEEMRPHENSKPARVVKNLVKIYRGHKNANQVVFMGQGMSKVVTRSEGPTGQKRQVRYPAFSTMHDMVERLVQEGIPKEHIAIVDGKTSKDKRKAIADMMNTGEIRIVFGSTGSLGVGVNMQRNLRAMHHMDAPWMPGDLEQRNGRGHRQGNQWNTVMEYRYLTDKLDGRRWQVLAIKQRFINEFMRSDGELRVIEGDAASDEQSDIMSTLSEAAGDPRLLVRAKLQKQIDQLYSRERVHGFAQVSAKSEIKRLDKQVENTQKRLQEVTEGQLVEKVRTLIESQKTKAFKAVLGGKSFDNRADANKYLRENANTLIPARSDNVKVGQYGPYTLYGNSSWASDPDVSLKFGNEVIESNGPSILSLESELRKFRDEAVAGMESSIAKDRSTKNNMESVAVEPFHMQDKLDAKVKEFRDLQVDMDVNPVAPPYWLRTGAPVETVVQFEGKSLAVAGHRWTNDGYFVLLAGNDGELIAAPYMDVTDTQGMALYEQQTFKSPVTERVPAAKEDDNADDGSLKSAGKAKLTGKGVSHAQAKEAYDKFIALMPGLAVDSDKLRIMDYPLHPMTGKPNPNNTDKAAYNVSTGKLQLYTANIENGFELDKAIIHELLVHRGLGLYSVEALDKKIRVFRRARRTDKAFAKLVDQVEQDYGGFPEHLVIEETLARMAEDMAAGKVYSAWYQFKRWIVGLARKYKVGKWFMKDETAMQMAEDLLLEMARKYRKGHVVKTSDRRDPLKYNPDDEYGPIDNDGAMASRARGGAGSNDLADLQARARALIPRVEKAYKDGDLDVAESLDAELESIYEYIENYTSEAQEDGMTFENENGYVDVPLIGDLVDTEQQATDLIYFTYKKYFVEDLNNTYSLYDEQGAMAILRGAFDTAGDLMGGFDGTATDKALLEAAKELYESRVALQNRRQSGKKKFGKSIADIAPNILLSGDSNAGFMASRAATGDEKVDHNRRLMLKQLAGFAAIGAAAVGSNPAIKAFNKATEGDLKQGKASAITLDMTDAKLDEATMRVIAESGDLRKALTAAVKSAPKPLKAVLVKLAGLVDKGSIKIKVDAKRRVNVHGTTSLKDNGTVTLFTNGDSAGDDFGTLIHEALHAVVVQRYRTLSIGSSESNYQKLNVDKPANLQAMKQFEKLWNEYSRVIGRLPKAKQDALKESLSISEALRSPDEFFVRALSDADFQIHLAGLEYQGKTLMARFKDWVKRSLFGDSGTVPSWLDAALLGASDVMDGMSLDKADNKFNQAVIDHYAAIDKPLDEPDQMLASIKDVVKQKAKALKKQGGKDWLKNLVADSRKNWLGLIPRRYLAELSEGAIPSIYAYLKRADQMDADRNHLMKMPAKMVDEWRSLNTKNPDEGKVVATLMHEATIAGYDPSKEYEPLRDVARFDGRNFMSKDEFATGEVITPEYVRRRTKEIKEQAKSRSGEGSNKFYERIEYLKNRLAQQNNRDSVKGDIDELWAQLSPEAKQVFERARDGYLEQSNEYQKTLEQRITETVEDERHRAAWLGRIRMMFETQKAEGPYFPLQRFGDYFAVVKRGEAVLEFVRFEKQSEQRAWMESRQEQLERGELIESGKLMQGASDSLKQVDPEYHAKVMATLDNSGVQAGLMDEVNQLYLAMLPEMSMRKHFIHRKKVAGYNPDALRAFSHNMFHGAYQLSKLKHSHKMEKYLRDMRQEAKTAQDANRAADMVVEMEKRHQWAMNPKSSPWAAKATSFGFAWYLGVTPAAAMVNLTQTPMMGLPILGSRYGYVKAAKALLQAGKDFVGGKGHVDKRLNDHELKAFREFERSGLIDKTLAHDLAGVAEGGLEYSSTAHKVMSGISYLFHHAERFNREVTAMAAYRLAHATGDVHAVKTADALTKDSHFDYSNAERARFMQNDAAKVLLLFRQHSLNMTYRMARDFNNMFRGVSPKVRKQARRQFAGIMGMSALFAGAAGLPLFTVLGNVLELALDDEDEPWEFETEFRLFLTEHLGADGAKLVMHGALDSLTGATISSRVSLNNLWLREPDPSLEGRGLVQYYAEQALGPIFGIATSAGTAVSLMSEGQIQRGVEYALPKVLKDSMRAVRYANEGVSNLRGDQLVDELGAVDELYQLLGFTPSTVSEQYEQNRAITGPAKRILKRRQLLMNQFALAKRLDDRVLLGEVNDRIDRFNRANPSVKISAKAKLQSLRRRKEYSKRAVNGRLLDPRLAHLAEQNSFLVD